MNAAVIGWILIALGIVLFFVAVLMVLFKVVKERRIEGFRGGGLIMLGPIPIIFGSDKGIVKTLVILSLILISVVLIFMLISILSVIIG